MNLRRINPLIALAILCVVVITSLFFIKGSSPKEIGNEFMIALAKGDVQKLCDLGYTKDMTDAEEKRQWEFATQVAAPYYRFMWRVGGESHPDATSASVQVLMNRGQGEEEKFEVPLIQMADKKWYVDVRELNRNMYPALPR